MSKEVGNYSQIVNRRREKSFRVPKEEIEEVEFIPLSPWGKEEDGEAAQKVS